MTHTRLRKFNTRDTYPGSRMDNDLCQVARAVLPRADRALYSCRIPTFLYIISCRIWVWPKKQNKKMNLLRVLITQRIFDHFLSPSGCDT